MRCFTEGMMQSTYLMDKPIVYLVGLEVISRQWSLTTMLVLQFGSGCAGTGRGSSGTYSVYSG